MSPQFTHPLQYRLPAFSDSWIADSRVLLEGTLFPHRRHAHTLSIFLKLQSVSRPHPEPPPHFPRYGDLPLARDLRLFLHRRTPISLLYHIFLTSELTVTKRCGSCPFRRHFGAVSPAFFPILLTKRDSQRTVFLK